MAVVYLFFGTGARAEHQRWCQLVAGATGVAVAVLLDRRFMKYLSARAVAARNAFKVDYRLGLFSNTGMASYDAFVAAGKTDAQIIASASRTNAGFNSAAATLAGSAAAHSGRP